MTKYPLSLYIFRTSLRLHDNTALIASLKESEKVLPIFIFTPTQIDRKKNRFFSDNAVQFMVECLNDLDSQLHKKGSKLFYFHGEPDKVVNKLIKRHKISAVFVNADYTPYSMMRDGEIKKVCDDAKIPFISHEDLLLHPVATITNSSNEIYTKFTPYYSKAKKIAVRKPEPNKHDNYVNSGFKAVDQYEKEHISKLYKHNDSIAIHGGRGEATKILDNIKTFKSYNKERNTLSKQTTMLSGHNKFGSVSIREVYHTIKKHLGQKNELIKQLFWRDFYYNIAYKHPELFKRGNNLKPNYNKIKWLGTESSFNKWKNGETGFPVVDACMRQLNETGYMHNRGRLIVSNFLIKLLLIDWRKGEEYFAQHLLDYDPSVNNGNWAWSAGSGADAQPYFRVFNPWLQSYKFDKDAEYIKKWIPDLKDVEPDHIHNWYKYYDRYETKYPKPIISYSKNKQAGLKMYSKIF